MIGALAYPQKGSEEHQVVIFVNYVGSHNQSSWMEEALVELIDYIRFFPPCSINLT